MFAFFPEPYPDETIYSLICRYLDMEQINFRRLQTILNQKTFDITTHVLPVVLEKLAAQLPAQWNMSATAMLENHTVFPYYRPFTSPTRAVKLMKEALKRPRAAAKFGYGSRSVPLRFCPGCVKQDLDEGREPYFRCSHHIIGSPACAAHGLLLEEIKVRGEMPFKPLSQIAAIKTREGKAAPWRLVRLAHDIEYCAARWQNRRPEEILKAMEAQLLSRGSRFLSVVHDIYRRIATYVSSIAGYLPYNFRQSNPLKEIFSRKKYVAQPYQILLLIRAIGLNPKTLFLTGDKTRKRRGTWCVNPTCRCYHQVVQVRFGIHEPAWRQNLTVRCVECGLSYVADKVTVFSKFPPPKPQIVDLGERLNDHFKALWMNPNLSFRKIAKEMGFSTKSTTLFRAARANNLPLDRGGAGVLTMKLRTVQKQWATQAAKLETNREVLQKLKEQNPSMTVAQARALNPKVCIMVFSRDFAWWANFFGLSDSRRLHPLIENHKKLARQPIDSPSSRRNNR